MNRAARAVVVVALCMLGAVVVLPGTPATAAAASGSFSIEPSQVDPGARVVLTGTGFRPSANVKLEVCGNRALDGSIDCSLTTSKIVRTWTDGALHAEVIATAPPKPCPCVVRVTDVDEARTTSVDLVINGAAVAVPQKAAPLAQRDPTLRVRNLHVESSTSVGSLFGASADRVLVLTVRNSGTNTLEDVLMSAAWGGGSDPSHIIPGRRLEALAPGQARTVRLPFRIDALTVGSVDVVGTAGVVGNRVAFSTSTSAWPFALLVVLVALVALLVVAWVRRRRRRRRAREVASSTPSDDHDESDGLTQWAAEPEPNGSDEHPLPVPVVSAPIRWHADATDPDPVETDAVRVGHSKSVSAMLGAVTIAGALAAHALRRRDAT